jgi:hypothetical protein
MLMILQIALGIVLAVAILANYQRIIVVGRKAAIGLGALMAVAAVGFGLYMAFEAVRDRQRLAAEETAMFEERYAREQASKETGQKPWERDWSQATKEAKPVIDPSQIIWDDEPKEQAKPGD